MEHGFRGLGGELQPLFTPPDKHHRYLDYSPNRCRLFSSCLGMIQRASSLGSVKRERRNRRRNASHVFQLAKLRDQEERAHTE